MNEFVKRYKEMCPDFKLVYNIEESFRVNTLKINERELIARLRKNKIYIKKIPWLSHGYWYKSDFSIATTIEHLLGYFYIQSAPSQLVVEILAPKDNELILDMCAAPGGKTTHIAMIMKNKGRIIALDKDKNRLLSLRNNIERLSINNIICIKKDARYASELGIEFDKILLDAPCSGNYCSENGWFSKRCLDNFLINAEKQKVLIEEAYKVLKRKGILVYSACSLEPEENEEIIDWFIKKHPDMNVVEINCEVASKGLIKFYEKRFSNELKKTLRFWPHKTNTEGFFIAKLIKN